MSYEAQLKWIHALQESLRSPVMDLFFKGWHYVDSAYFAYIAITFVWYLWNKRLGAKLFYILIFGAIFNKLLKFYFAHPRPCQIDPLVGLLCLKSPGLPSGAAQSAALYCGFIFLECKKTLPRVLAVIFAFFLCFSRVYLGVHFVTDIIGGIVVGGFLLLIYHYLFNSLEKHWRPLSLFFPFLFLIGPFFVPKFSTFFYTLFFACLGVGIGLVAPKKQIHDTLNFKVRVFRLLSVLVGVVALSFIGIFYPPLLSIVCFVQGYWLSYLGAKIIPEKKSIF